jgi:hypothetical protein
VSLRRRTPLRRTSGLGRSVPLERQSEISRGRRRPTPAASATEIFKEAVCSEPCIGLQIAGHECEPPLQAMHVVPKRTLRRRGLEHLVWDPINGVPGCYRLHRRHDNAVEKIPRELLPERCVTWARTHGLEDALDRHWPSQEAA